MTADMPDRGSVSRSGVGNSGRPTNPRRFPIAGCCGSQTRGPARLAHSIRVSISNRNSSACEPGISKACKVNTPEPFSKSIVPILTLLKSFT